MAEGGTALRIESNILELSTALYMEVNIYGTVTNVEVHALVALIQSLSARKDWVRR